jgi:hypothetical protein
MKWELYVVITILLSGSGSVSAQEVLVSCWQWLIHILQLLLYFLKQHFDKRYEKGFSTGVNEHRPGLVEAADKSEMEELIKELRNLLKLRSMQPTKDRAQDS